MTSKQSMVRLTALFRPRLVSATWASAVEGFVAPAAGALEGQQVAASSRWPGERREQGARKTSKWRRAVAGPASSGSGGLGRPASRRAPEAPASAGRQEAAAAARGSL